MTGINNKKPATKPTKPEVKTQAVGKPMPITKYIDKMNQLYGSSDVDEYGNVESATDRIQEQYPKEASATQVAALKARLDRDPNRPQHSKKMSATRSWQIIKQSMDKDELAEHYKDHHEDRPIELTPFKPDPMLEEIYQGTVVNPKFEAAKRQYLKDEEARRVEKKRTAAAGIRNVLNFYK